MIRNIGDTRAHIYDATLIGEVIPKSLKDNQNGRSFNCEKQGHLKRDWREGILEIVFFFSRDNPKRRPH